MVHRHSELCEPMKQFARFIKPQKPENPPPPISSLLQLQSHFTHCKMLRAPASNGLELLHSELITLPSFFLDISMLDWSLRLGRIPPVTKLTLLLAG